MCGAEVMDLKKLTKLTVQNTTQKASTIVQKQYHAMNESVLVRLKNDQHGTKHELLTISRHVMKPMLRGARASTLFGAETLQ